MRHTIFKTGSEQESLANRQCQAQLSPQVVAGTQTCTGLKPPTFRSKGESANQYTMIASLPIIIFQGKNQGKY